MKIDFRKITSCAKPFSVHKDNLILQGEVRQIDQKLFRIDSVLSGEIGLVCDRTGENYFEKIEEVLVLYISNGIWDTQSQKLDETFDVIEFFDGFIDFEYILQSEIDSIQMQYHINEGV